MAGRSRTKSVIGVLTVTACLLLLFSYLGTDTAARRSNSLSSSVAQKDNAPNNIERKNTDQVSKPRAETAAVVKAIDSGRTKGSEGALPAAAEVNLAPLDEQEALQLKRDNFEAFLRYQQRLSASNRTEPTTNPEVQKSATEDRVQKRVSNILLAAKEKSK